MPHTSLTYAVISVMNGGPPSVSHVLPSMKNENCTPYSFEATVTAWIGCVELSPSTRNVRTDEIGMYSPALAPPPPPPPSTGSRAIARAYFCPVALRVARRALAAWVRLHGT